MGEAKAGNMAAAERSTDWRFRAFSRSAGPGSRLRRIPVGIREAERQAVGSYVTFRVFSERHPYGWNAEGLVLSNDLATRGSLVLYEYSRKTYTIPWRYFVNGLVYVFERKEHE